MVRPSTRAGVPVLNRRTVKPRSIRFCVSAVAGAKPLGPALCFHSPAMTAPFKYTPVASTAALAGMISP